jgi:hypothetical protein
MELFQKRLWFFSDIYVLTDVYLNYIFVNFIHFSGALRFHKFIIRYTVSLAVITTLAK